MKKDNVKQANPPIREQPVVSPPSLVTRSNYPDLPIKMAWRGKYLLFSLKKAKQIADELTQLIREIDHERAG